MNWIRARSDEQIEQRIAEILDATARLYRDHRFEDITFAMIAKEAGFTRSNLYRYFQTKEEIFLKLLENDIAAWRREVEQSMSGGYGSMHDAAEVWIALLLQQGRMIGLLTLLFTLLEENSSLDALTAFKIKLIEELDLAARFLATIFPFPSLQAAAEFLWIQTSLTIGYYPMLDLTDKQKHAMRNAGMVTDADHFRRQFVRATEILLIGMLTPAS